MAVVVVDQNANGHGRGGERHGFALKHDHLSVECINGV